MQYIVRRSGRARRMRLEVQPDGAVVLTAPERFSLETIEQFFARYAGWAHRAAARMRGRPVIRVRRADIPVLKRRARKIAEEGVAQIASWYGVRYGAISIRAQKSRWGSCSRAGNLSFNYKIAALPEEVARYVIVHEVCHLLVFNHSARFWAQVERTIPNHREVRGYLRRVSFVFHSE